MAYDHQKIEKKWQKKWEKEKLFEVKENPKKKKLYVLDMFPYPSAEGLHVGHPEGYTATDIVSRKRRMEGWNVLHPMGFDAFGLPTENYAIKHGVHPRTATEKNIKRIREQIKSLGFSYDWSREINTTDPNYYKWTQWIFLKLFQRGLAYQATVPINWCPSCKTGLANEEVIDGKCERCKTKVTKKDMRQWMLKISAYADRLLEDLKDLDWSEQIKEMQRNWIGRSEGALVRFNVIPAEAGIQETGSGPLKKGLKSGMTILEIFTTRPDTLFGATYMVVAPEHEIISKIKNQISNIDEVEKYIQKAKEKSDLERAELLKEKTGVELKGVKAINPVNGAEIPIWVADYVLPHYGTGAIMAVPAHDERDFEFAKKFGLPIREVVARKFGERRPDAVRRDGVAGVVLNKDKKVLVLHDKKFDIYRLPAGGYEKNETPEETLKREIQEESGYVNVKIEEFLGTIETNFDMIFKKEYRHKFQKGYLARLLGDEQGEMNEEGKEIFEKMWLDYGEAMKRFAKNKESWGEEEFIRRVFEPKEKCFAGEGTAINSDFLDGLPTVEAKEKIIKWLEEKGFGKKAVNYKLRDWVFSRQRYWGEPIPLVYCEKCGWMPVEEKDLPVKLPDVKKYEPTGTGESPLAAIEKWVNTKCPVCGGPARRETNTMPQWAGSCWYYLAYLMLGNQKSKIKNQKFFWDKKKIDYWMPVDLYVGGAEHAVLHLLYARFWHKVLYDEGLVKTVEPFMKLKNQGIILGEDGVKMSKSRGNVINPDDVINQYGADTMRLYEMFMGPFEDVKPWSTKGIIGVRRFLERVWGLEKLKVKSKKLKVTVQDSKLERLLHKTIKKVTEDIESFKFNTAISAMMILANEMAVQTFNVLQFEIFLKLLSPFAPHIAEELWEKLGHKKSIVIESWPKYDPALIVEEEIDLVVQINGKVRDTLRVKADINEEEAKKAALKSEKIKKWVEGKEIRKVIFVKGKLINIVI